MCSTHLNEVVVGYERHERHECAERYDLFTWQHTQGANLIWPGSVSLSRGLSMS